MKEQIVADKAIKTDAEHLASFAHRFANFAEQAGRPAVVRGGVSSPVCP